MSTARSSLERGATVAVRRSGAAARNRERFWEREDGERLESVRWKPASCEIEVRFAAGRSYCMPLDGVPGIDPADVRACVLDDLRHGVVLTLSSGRKVDFASDLVLHRCDAGYRRWYEERSEPIEEPARERVGRRVREIRKRRGLSLAALASAAGLTKGNASRIENGRHDPRLDTLVRLAKALGVTVTDIVSI